jgi:hypothetical protein
MAWYHPGLELPFAIIGANYDFVCILAPDCTYLWGFAVAEEIKNQLVIHVTINILYQSNYFSWCSFWCRAMS